MRKKGILVIIIFLFIISLSLGIVGYFESKSEREVTPNVPLAPKISYLYFLEDKEVTYEELFNKEIETSTSEISNIENISNNIELINSVCTNGVTGSFDFETKSFIPDQKKDSTCRLYFVKSNYEVTLTATNGIAEYPISMVKRGENGTFIINPNEGYEFDNAICSDNKEYSWNDDENEFKLNDIMDDIACKVVFKVKKLNVKIVVINGNENSEETYEYGEAVTGVVAPYTNYDSPVISCTNGQSASINKDNNTYTIEKLTDNTECTITYKEKEKVKYKLEIVNLPIKLDFINGSSSQEVLEGDTGTFKLKPKESNIVIDEIKCTNSKNEDVIPTTEIDDILSTYEYSFKGMNSNITCEIFTKTVQ